MAHRIDYLSQTRNQVVVKYTHDGSAVSGDLGIFMGPTAFGAATGPDAVTGLTYSSVALKSVVYGIYDSGVAGGRPAVAIVFKGSAADYGAFLIPRGAGVLDFERFTVPNLAGTPTGMVTFTNPGVTASIIAVFCTRQ